MLRCLELGLRPSDLLFIEFGMVQDMLTEKGNDNEDYNTIATQEDFDRF